MTVSIHMEDLRIRYLELPLTASNVRIVNSAPVNSRASTDRLRSAFPLVGPESSLDALNESNLLIVIDLKGAAVADEDVVEARATVPDMRMFGCITGRAAETGFR